MRGKQFLSCGAALTLGLTASISTGVIAEEKTCDYFSIDDAPVTFCELQDAVNSLNSEHHTIKLLKDFEGDGVIVEGKDVKFDFNQHTFKASGTLAGSTGTKSQIFQLLKGSTVSMHNGTLTSDTAKMYIQNYSDLTLNNMTLDASEKSQVMYVVSNNYGSLDVQNDTAIIAPEGAVAFDLWYGMHNDYADGISVNFGEEFTGLVKGKVEYGRDNSSFHAEDWQSITKLTISGGKFDVDLQAGSTNALNGASIELSGGSFSGDPSQYVKDGYYVDQSKDDSYEVKKISSGKLPTGITVEIGAVSGGIIPEGDIEEKLAQLEDTDLAELNIAKIVDIVLKDTGGTPIHETGKAYAFEIETTFPELAEGYTRKYYVVRYHMAGDGELVVDSWETEYKDGKIIIESNLFSQFAIGYIDTKDIKAPDTGKGAVSATIASSVAAAVVASTLVSTAYAVSRAKRQ